MSPSTPNQTLHLALAHHDAGRLREAEILCRQILKAQPHHPDALHLLGLLAGQAGHLDDAARLIQKAIALTPQNPLYYSNLGNFLLNNGLHDQAIAALRQAIALKPNYVEAHDNLLFALHYHPDTTPQTLFEETQRWNHQHAQPLAPLIQPHPNTPDPHRPLRIGYVSADFKDHVSAYFLEPLFSSHNHHQFQIFCYAEVPTADPRTSQIKKYADHWRDTASLSDQQIATLIRHDQIDILIDLKLHTAFNRLLVFARKPAPLQITWLGYPGTTGLTTIDYRLTDSHLDPPGTDESLYSETTLRLPDSFWCYHPLDARDIPLSPLPALAAGHITFGSLNNFCKINDPLLILYAQVLQGVPASRLLLLAPPGSARERTLKILQQQNISPDRIDFIPRQPRPDYLQTFHRIDICLDTLPYNGHTTSFDSIYMGAPLITLLGQTVVGRAGASLLNNLHLPELIAHTPEEYIQIAVNLANDLTRLQTLRATLRDRLRSSPLMNAPLFARNLEHIYRTLWQKWCKAHP